MSKIKILTINEKVSFDKKPGFLINIVLIVSKNIARIKNKLTPIVKKILYGKEYWGSKKLQTEISK
ncbi:hypothetical protein EPO66_00865 [bacterium]|nr:MAG: hypothetical protein EPO66_00865 [bacterium]